MSEELVSDGVDGIRTTRLLARAIKERWPIPEEKRASMTNRIIQDVEEGKTARVRVAAYKAVVAADKLNKEEKPQEPQQHLHLHQTQTDLSKLSQEKLEALEQILLAAQGSQPASSAGSVVEGIAVPVHPERLADD